MKIRLLLLTMVLLLCGCGDAAAPTETPISTSAPAPTETSAPEENREMLTVDYAGDELLQKGEYEKFVAAEDEYSFPFVLYFGQPMRDVQLCTVSFADSGYVIDEVLATWTELDAEMPLVIYGSFPGDMSAYGIVFTDSSGTVHQKTIYMSGRDGSMQLGEL